MEEDKYKDALERAKEKYFNKEYKPNEAALVKEILEEIFFELGGNKDERIRKAIIAHMNLVKSVNGVDVSDILAYLEKLKDFDKQLEDAYKNSDEVQYKRGYDAAMAEKAKFVDVEVEPSWFHHKVDLSGNSEEYRKAYYDGWNNCAQQYIQYKSESNDVIRCLIHGMERLKDDRFINWGTDKWYMKVEDILHGLRNLEKGLINELTHKEVTKKSEQDKEIENPDDIIDEYHQQQADDLIDMVTKKSTWSDEDEYLLKWSLNNLQEIQHRFGSDYGIVGKCIDWLKSIKERLQ